MMSLALPMEQGAPPARCLNRIDPKKRLHEHLKIKAQGSRVSIGLNGFNGKSRGSVVLGQTWKGSKTGKPKKIRGAVRVPFVGLG